MQFVKSYLDIRYKNVYSGNVYEKSKLQLDMLDKSLLNNSYKYGDSNEYINEIIDKSLNITIEDKQVKFQGFKKGKIVVNTKVFLLITSNKLDDWCQTTEYDLQFILKKKGWNQYLIDYIKELNVKRSTFSNDKKENNLLHEHVH